MIKKNKDDKFSLGFKIGLTDYFKVFCLHLNYEEKSREYVNYTSASRVEISSRKYILGERKGS